MARLSLILAIPARITSVFVTFGFGVDWAYKLCTWHFNLGTLKGTHHLHLWCLKAIVISFTPGVLFNCLLSYDIDKNYLVRLHLQKSYAEKKQMTEIMKSVGSQLNPRMAVKILSSLVTIAIFCSYLEKVDWGIYG